MSFRLFVAPLISLSSVSKLSVCKPSTSVTLLSKYLFKKL